MKKNQIIAIVLGIIALAAVVSIFGVKINANVIKVATSTSKKAQEVYTKSEIDARLKEIEANLDLRAGVESMTDANSELQEGIIIPTDSSGHPIGLIQGPVSTREGILGTCEESDGGFSPLTRGRVVIRSPNGTIMAGDEDYCAPKDDGTPGDNTLMELSCYAISLEDYGHTHRLWMIWASSYQCGKKNCVNGKCVDPRKPPKHQSYSTDEIPPFSY